MKHYQRLLEDAIKNSKFPRMVVYATGGGSHFFQWLMSSPSGASSLLLEGSLPCHFSAFNNILCHHNFSIPTSCCSRDAAELLSRSALNQAVKLVVSVEGFSALPISELIGVGVTCSLKSCTAKRDGHQAYVATSNLVKGTSSSSFIFEQGVLSPEEEDAQVSIAIAEAALEAMGIPNTNLSDSSFPSSAGLHSSDAFAFSAKLLLEQLVNGEVTHVVYGGSSDVWIPAPPLSYEKKKLLVFPGTFCPLHGGHERLAHDAAKLREHKTGEQQEVLFEISLSNVDKGAISIEHLLQTATVFKEKGLNLLITTASLFSEKAKLCKNASFIMGYDTFTRLIDSRYYGNNKEDMQAAIAQIKAFGCTVIVAGRLVGEEYKSLENNEELFSSLPPSLASMFEALPNFRIDLSSSDLRKEV